MGLGRILARSVVELCITIGALMVLLVVYVFYWTSVTADSAMRDEVSRLNQQWRQSASGPDSPQMGQAAAASPSPTPSAPASARAPVSTPPTAYPPGTAFAVLYIPRFGKDWAKPVIEGVGVPDLQKGIGHYPGTAALGGSGNFALAGHRRTYGNPFNDFPELRPGDAVVLRDAADWYVYRLDRKPFLTLPTDIHVLDSVPPESGYSKPGHYLTLTTCDPPWGHSHRLIEWGHLESVTPVGRGTPDALK